MSLNQIPNTFKSLLGQESSMLDHARMMEVLDDMAVRYPFLSIAYIGESMMGKGIPVILLGEGEKSIVYVGAQNGTEWMTTLLLLRMVGEYCELYQSKSRLFHYSMPYLFSSRTLYILPMLNPDGVDYHLHGVRANHILYERLLGMNHGSTDFSQWNANARGVDLTRNYNYCFTGCKRDEAVSEIGLGASAGYSGQAPESEPETGHFCNYLRFHPKIHLLLELRAEGKRITYPSPQNSVPRTGSIAEILARTSGYSKYCMKEADLCGDLIGWCGEELKIPALRIGCGIDGTQNAFSLYTRIRETLFTAPSLI